MYKIILIKVIKCVLFHFKSKLSKKNKFQIPHSTWPKMIIYSGKGEKVTFSISSHFMTRLEEYKSIIPLIKNPTTWCDFN